MTSASSPLPPRLPAWLLEHTLPTQALEYVLGDLAEEYALRSESGSSNASLWYWLQISRSLPTLFSAALRYAGLLRTIGVAVAVFVVASVAESLVNMTIMWLAPEGLISNLAMMLVGTAAIGAGGYIAARIRPPAAPVLSIIVFVVVVALITLKGDDVPVWYQVVYLVTGPFIPLAGGVMASRRARRRGGNAVC